MEEHEQIYPRRLHHVVPRGVPAGALFHIRLRSEKPNLCLLTDPDTAAKLLKAARYYHKQGRWFCHLILLMPDHLHALLAFAPNVRMSRVIGDWKRFTAQDPGVRWQENYFDHRIRNQQESAETYAYILRNPIARGLCGENQNWSWQWCGETALVWGANR